MVSPVRGVPNWNADFHDKARKAAANDPVAKNELDHTLQTLDDVTSTLLKVAAIGVLLILADSPIIGLSIIAFLGLNIYTAENKKTEIYEAIHRASDAAIQTISRAAKDLHREITDLTTQADDLTKQVRATEGHNEAIAAVCANLENAAARLHSAADQLPHDS